MTAKIKLLEQQRSWATEAGHTVDAGGYMTSVDANLLQSFSAVALAGLSSGSGSELRDTARRPAKLKALHSSAALAINVFDYWTSRSPHPLQKALGLEDAIGAIEFEAQFPTGLEGNPPNIDVVLRLESGTTIGIESKFTEWLAPKSSNKELFSAKYFAEEVGLWTKHGLPHCQELVNDIRHGRQSFRHLDTAQLLKHALGLACGVGDRFCLYYLYFDVAGTMSEEHRRELDLFSHQVGKELRFQARTYQSLFRALVQSAETDDAPYIEYLRRRYFPQYA